MALIMLSANLTGVTLKNVRAVAETGVELRYTNPPLAELLHFELESTILINMETRSGHF